MAKNQSCSYKKTPIYLIGFVLTIFVLADAENENKCKIDERKLLADCRGLNLTDIPQNLPEYITKLDLQHNAIVDLSGGKFRRYNKLTYLELSFNYIQTIPDDAFYGLLHIIYISVACNKLNDQSLVQNKAFSILKYIETVDIGFNDFTKVPNVSVFNPHLKTLKLCSLFTKRTLSEATLGPSFSTLVNLQELDMQDMQITELNKKSFQYVSTTLKKLRLQGNPIRNIANDTFSRLNNLQCLWLDVNHYLDSSVLEIGLTSLKDTDIRFLYLRNMYNLIEITRDTLASLRKTPLEYLDFSYGISLSKIDDYGLSHLNDLKQLMLYSIAIENLTTHSFYGLEKLEVLDLSENYDLQNIGFSLQNLSNLVNLTFMSDINLSSLSPGAFQRMFNLKHFSLEECALSNLHRETFQGLSSLLTLDISHNNLLENGYFYGLRNLTDLDISYTHIKDLSNDLCEANIVPQLIKLDASNTNIISLEAATFQKCEHLVQVLLNSCQHLQNISTAFTNVNSLRYLDLSYNAFRESPMPGAFNISQSFDTLLYNQVKENGSYIKQIPLAIKYSTNIYHLEICFNGIWRFNHTDMAFIKKLHSLHAEFNPYDCNCSYIQLFYHWLVDPKERKNIIPYNETIYYVCHEPSKFAGHPIRDFEIRICDNLHVNIVILVCSTICSVLFTGLIIGGLGYHKRWTIRYFYYYVSVVRKRNNSPDEYVELDKKIEFDAFVSYSFNDIKFVKNVLLKTIDYEYDNANEEITFSAPGATRFKAHYLNTVSAIVMICIKIHLQYHRRNLHQPCKMLHYTSCMCQMFSNGKIRHPAAKPQHKKQLFKQKGPKCILIKNSRHTSKVVRKLYYRRKLPCYGRSRLCFDKETIWLKKWVHRYEKSIQSLKIKEQKLKRQLKKDRVHESDQKSASDARSSIRSSSQEYFSAQSSHGSPSTQGSTTAYRVNGHSHDNAEKSLQKRALKSRISPNNPQGSQEPTAQNSPSFTNTNSENTVFQSTTIDVSSCSESNNSQSLLRAYSPLQSQVIPRYKLMVCHRDFPLGTDLGETIVLYMERSRKSIVCISDDFLKGDWTMFEWEITVRERNGAMLLILLHSDIDRKKMPRYMRSLLKSKIYLEWTENDDYGKRYFWARLVEFLGKPIEQIRKEESNEKYIQSKKKELIRKRKNETRKKQQEEGNDIDKWVPENVDRTRQLRRDAWVNSEIFSEPLTLRDRERILESYDDGWISKKIINASMAVLQKQFPNTGGFQDCRNASRLSFESDKKQFIQILNMFLDKDSEIHGDVHWIVVSSIKCKSGNVKIYDSQNFNSVPDHVKMSIANLLQAHDLSKFRVCLTKSPQQLKDVDCGIYSIANTVSLLYSYDPCSIEYPSSLQMRKHLITCLEGGKFTMFPTNTAKQFGFFHSGEKRLRHKRVVEVHCKCKMLWDSRMVRCENCARFFHPSCLGQIMPGVQFRAYPGNFELCCNDCKNNQKVVTTWQI